jgi:hypothetical protein
MAAEFDVSSGSRSAIDDLLLRFTYTGTDRTFFIDNLFQHLTEFNAAHETFDLGLNQTHVNQRFGDMSNFTNLFKGIANAICKKGPGVVNFHHGITGKKYSLRGFTRHERHVFTWQYLHYYFKVFTFIKKVGPGFTELYEFHMRITDTDKEQDDSGESGADTEDDNEPSKPPRSLASHSARGLLDTDSEQMLLILQSLHDRITKLEASYIPPTASPRRLE